MRTSLAAMAAGLCLLWGATLSAEVINWSFPLSVDQERAAGMTVTIPDGAPIPSGTATIMLDTDTSELSWNVSYQDLTGPLTAAHFHGPAAAGVSTGVRLGISTGGPATGTITGTATLDPTQQMELLDHLWYVNLHTGTNGGGEIRGQVVPEPSAAILGLLAAAGLWGIRRRR